MIMLQTSLLHRDLGRHGPHRTDVEQDFSFLLFSLFLFIIILALFVFSLYLIVILFFLELCEFKYC